MRRALPCPAGDSQVASCARADSRCRRRLFACDRFQYDARHAERKNTIAGSRVVHRRGVQRQPGAGRLGVHSRHPATDTERESSGGERETTNNRMELTAVVRGLEALKRPSHVKLMTDSVYVGKGLSEWMVKWKANGWRRREGSQWKEVKNEDLWRQLDQLDRASQADLYPRGRPQRTSRERPLRRVGGGGVSTVPEAVGHVATTGCFVV